jgi:hypothetical protein
MNFRIYIFFISALLSNGAATDEANLTELMPITDARNTAVEYAMTQALIHSKIAEKCEKLPEPIKTNAKTALVEWRNRNQYLVTPTFFWINYVAKANPQNQDYVYLTMTSFDAKAKQAVKIAMPDRKPDASTCDEWLSKFSDTSLDLKNSEHATSLQEIREYSYKFSVPAGR